MRQERTSLGTLRSKLVMEFGAFFFVREGGAIQGTSLLDDNELKIHLLSRGVLTTNEDGIFSASFVGFVVWKSKLLIFLPKCFPLPKNGDECSAAARLTMRVLRKYSRNTLENDPDARRLSRNLTDPKASEFALATWLADDFLKNGLYRRTRSNFVVSGHGATDWQRTISRRTAYLSGGSAVYLDFITRDKVNDDFHFITRLHLAALKLCKRRYGAMLDLDDQVLERENVVSLEESALFEAGAVHLARELRHAYSDRAIRLLGVLDLLLKNGHPASATTFEAYGTNHFEYVWEKICSTIIGNDIAAWLHAIPSPIWQITSGHKEEAATLKPDIVRLYSHMSEKFVLLADAKYYTLKMPPDLAGNPGVGDVIKQLVYELVIVKEALERGMELTGNFFVFPQETQSKLISIAGTVAYSGVSAGPIRIAYMDIAQAMKRYLTDEALCDGEIDSLFELNCYQSVASS